MTTHEKFFRRFEVVGSPSDLRALLGPLVIAAMVLVPGQARAQQKPPALPTSPPIASPAMLGGAGPQFIDENYQLVAPLLRKCANDWPSTQYVEYRPDLPGKVSIASAPMKVLPFLKVMAEQTGRRFAVQRGLEREAVVAANGEDWLPVLERYVDTAGLDLENVQDILVISDPKTAVQAPKSGGTNIIIAIGLVIATGIGLAWYVVRPKKRVDPRGGWV